MISASRSASSPASGSCSRTPVEQRCAPPRRRQRVGVAVLARERLAGLLGGGAQGVGVARAAPPRPRAARPRPARGRRPRSRRARTGAGRPPGRARGRWRPPRRARARWPRAGACSVGVRRQQRGHRLAAEPVERLALGPRPEQPVLVGLAVHRDQRLGDLGQRGDRDRGAADEGPRAALGRDVAGQHDAVVLDLAAGLLDRGGEPGEPVASTTPSTRAVPAPVRTAPLSARPPSSRPSAVTTMVLPAPVSPVMTVSPGPSSSVEDSMTPSEPIRISSSIALPSSAAPSARRRRSAEPRQPSTGRPNLATSRSVNGASCSRTSRTGALRAAYLDPGARRQVDRPPAVAPQHAGAVGAGEHLDREHRVGRDHHRPGEQRVRADRHHQQRLDARPDDRAAGAEVVGRRAGRRRAARRRRSPSARAAGRRSRRRPRASARGRPSRRWPR